MQLEPLYGLLHQTSFSGRKILHMPTRPAEAASLAITRSTTSVRHARLHKTHSTSLYYLTPGKITEIVVGTILSCILCVSLVLLAIKYRKRLRQSLHSTSNYFRPSSERFIFRRCWRKRIKHGGPLEQDYQPYEMMRPQGHHDAEAGVNKGFGDEDVSEG